MRYPKTVLILLLICLSARLLFFVLVKPWEPTVRDHVILTQDALEYHHLAVSIIEDQRFASKKGGIPDTLRTPLYPLLISLIYAIWGSESTWRVLLVQILIDTGTCILLFFLILKFFNFRTAVYASFFYALDPFLILDSSTLLSEVLFVFLCLIAAYWFSEAIHRDFDRSTFYILLSAFFFGLATLVRPVAQYIPLIIILLLFIVLRKEVKKACKLALLFLILFVITLSPWIICNLSTFGVPSFSTGGPYNLIVLYVGPMEMERKGRSAEEVYGALLKEVDALILKEGGNPAELNEFQQARYWGTLAFQYITKHPLFFIKHYALGIIHSFANLGTGPYGDLLQLPKKAAKLEIKAYPNIFELLKTWFNQKASQEIKIGLFIASYLLVTYTLLIIGLIVSWWEDRRIFLLFCLMMALYFLLITGTAGLARFKIPAVPFYLVFVAMGLSFVFREKNQFARKESS